MTAGAQSWAAVVPVKRLSRAKTRLAVDDRVRAELALAMATDTVAACLAARLVTAVVVVTDDERAAAVMRELGATVVADLPDAGLNPALRHGAAVAARSDDVGVVVVSSDLPALSGVALDDVLRRAADRDSACVADAAGTGTTLLAARTAASFEPAFGPHSRQRHRDAGATDLTEGADARVRRDVDTLTDLADAASLGCGPATTALLASAAELSL